MKLPKTAKKVFEGVLFDIYQWPQKMFDGSIHTFEGIKRQNTVLIIPTIHNHVVVTHQKQPDKPDYYYSLLGGRQEKNEEPLETAKRELLEESGLQSQDWELYKIYDNLSKFDWELYLFIARNCKKVAEQKLDPGEIIELIEISFEEFVNLHSNEMFWGGEITIDILKMQLNPELLDKFKKKILS